MVSFGRKFVLLSDMIPLESARETYGAYHESVATSLKIVVLVAFVFHPAALKAILRNSARVRLLSGLYSSTLFTTHRATRCSIYPFAQLLEISVNFISERDLRATHGFLKIVVVTPVAVVVVIMTSPFVLEISTVTPLSVEMVVPEHFPS